MKDLEYGSVAVIGGRYKGRIGYYDDDELIKAGDRAVVYFDNPLTGTYVLIKHEHITNIIDLHFQRLRREFPEECKQFGL